MRYPQMTNEKRITMLFTASPATQAAVDSILLGKSVAVPKREAAIASDSERKPAEAVTMLCTFNDAARRLGLSRHTLFRIVQDGRLETVRLNKVRRITLASIIKFAKGEGKEAEDGK